MAKNKVHRPTAKVAEDKEKAAAQACLEIIKKWGDGSVQKLGDKVGVRIPCIPTGLYSVDNYVAGAGGFPRGRLSEVFGPYSSGKTSLVLAAIAEAQAAGEIAAFVDAEHALDATYAAALGVDVPSLLVSQPNSGEEALDITESLVRSGAVGIVVVDSVAALVPQAELDGEIGDSNVGLHARLMSQAMRKMVGAVSKTNTALVFLNQLREKVGVMYGCFNYNARVVLADGSTEKIGKIVNQKLPVEVMSFNPETKSVEAKPVIAWHNNGKADYFLQIETTSSLGKNGKSSFGVTPNHMIFTPKGEVPAGELEVGDRVVSMARKSFSSLQMEIAAGSILGDGSVRPTGYHNTTLRIQHGLKQVEYAKYKATLFGNMLVDAGANKNSSWGFSTAASIDLTDLWSKCYSGKDRLICSDLLDLVTLQSVAIWYMDDGTFGGSYKKWGKGKSSICAKSYTEAELGLLADKLQSLGLPRPSVEKRGRLLWYGEDSYLFQKSIAKYIHPSMEYKIHPNLRGSFVGPEEHTHLYAAYQIVPHESVVYKIYRKPETESMNRFDVTVADNHTYFVDGVAVHNSPEVVTGGKALQFYASLRLDVRRVSTNKDGDEAVSNTVRIKAVKNKVSPPFRETEVEIVFGRGFLKASSLVQAGITNGAVTRSGSWLSFGEERLGQGADNASAALEANDELYGRVYAAVLQKDQEDKENKA